MNDSVQETSRILVIHPNVRGFGYVVFEGEKRLIDWGLKIATHDLNARCLGLLEDLINRYTPDLIVIEDRTTKSSRRRQRVKYLLARIVKLSAKREIECRHISRLATRETFAQFGSRSKYQIASTIAKQLPELAPWLPRLRKPWMSEDTRISIFAAAAMALTLFAAKDKVERDSSSSTKKPLR
jgi:hypothetical protein